MKCTCRCFFCFCFFKLIFNDDPIQHMLFFLLFLCCVDLYNYSIGSATSVTWTPYELFVWKCKKNWHAQIIPWRTNSNSTPGIRKCVTSVNTWSKLLYSVLKAVYLGQWKYTPNLDHECIVFLPHDQVMAIGLYLTYVPKEVKCSRCHCEL